MIQQALEIWKMIQDNALLVTGGILGLLAFAKLIAKITKTPKDDEYVEKADGFVRSFLKKIKLIKEDEPKKPDENNPS